MLYVGVVFVCIGFGAFFHYKGHVSEKYFLDKMTYLFNNSSIVQEDIYLNDTDGLEHELSYILDSIRFDSGLESVCGEITLTRSDINQYDYIRCSNNDDYEDILNLQPQTYTYPIKMVDKLFGHLTWRIITSEHFFSAKYITIYVLFVLSTLMYLWVINFYNSEYIIINKSKWLSMKNNKKDYEDIVSRVSQTLYMINSSAGGGNKKFFPLSDDVVYVEYKNAYSTIYYVNGKTIMLRVSLTEMENCIYNYFVRIKRNVLVNKYQITKCGKIESSVGNKIKLIISIKNRKKEFEITNEQGRLELSDHIRLRKN